MSRPPHVDSDGWEPDPVFIHSRREALLIFGLWFVCLMWAVPVSYLLGYGQSVTPENIPLVMGIPRWTFWGIVVPWLLADVVTTWFCFWYMKEDDLGHAADEEPAATNETRTDAGGTA